MLLICLLAFNVHAKDTNYWKDGITILNDAGLRCTAGVFNPDGAFFTFNIQTSENKKDVFFEFKSSVDIENKGELIADLDFYNSKKSKRDEIRIKLKPYSVNEKKLFILDTSINTAYSMEILLDLMARYKYFYIRTFDKQWVEYPFKFSLIGSEKQISIIKKECDFEF